MSRPEPVPITKRSERRWQLTRRAAVTGALASVAGCLDSGSSGTNRGVADIVAYNPQKDSQQVSVTVSDGSESLLEAVATVPGSGSVRFSNQIVMNQTVDVEVAAADSTASTDWTVEGTLYTSIRSDGIDFTRESEQGTPPTNEADGMVDVVVDNSDSAVEATIRVTEAGDTLFERTRNFPADARVAFYDRVESGGSVTVEATVPDGKKATEELSFANAVTVLVDIDDPVSFDLNYADSPGPKT